MAKPGRHPKGAKSRSPVQRAFLDAYAQLGNITAAAKAAGCDPSRHRNDWVKDPAYLAEFQEAHEQASDLLEAEALRRATRGTARGVYHQGKKIDTVMDYSDSLLIFLLKATRPGKFRESVDINHSGMVGTKLYGKDTPIDKV